MYLVGSFLSGHQVLFVLLLLVGPAAAGEAGAEAGRNCAEQDAQQGEEHTCSHQTGTYQLQLQRSAIKRDSTGTLLCTVDVRTNFSRHCFV